MSLHSYLRFSVFIRGYLDIRGKAAEDPLLPEIRRRAGR